MQVNRLVPALPLLAISAAALAQDKAPEPDYTLSYNIGAVTDYRYRGISQSRLKPALQGGADFAHRTGLYAGAWASTIRWIKDVPPADKGSLEVDLYGGYKGALTDKISLDVGGLYYWYVDNNYKRVSGVNANTFELYGALSFGPATLKYSHAATTLFGIATSQNSGYLDLSANFETGLWGLTATPHVGHQRVHNTRVASYTDYSVTLGRDFGNGLSASLAVVGTDADRTFYASPANGKFLGRSGVVAGAKYTF